MKNRGKSREKSNGGKKYFPRGLSQKPQKGTEEMHMEGCADVQIIGVRLKQFFKYSCMPALGLQLLYSDI